MDGDLHNVGESTPKQDWWEGIVQSFACLRIIPNPLSKMLIKDARKEVSVSANSRPFLFSRNAPRTDEVGWVSSKTVEWSPLPSCTLYRCRSGNINFTRSWSYLSSDLLRDHQLTFSFRSLYAPKIQDLPKCSISASCWNSRASSATSMLQNWKKPRCIEFLPRVWSSCFSKDKTPGGHACYWAVRCFLTYTYIIILLWFKLRNLVNFNSLWRTGPWL